MRVICVVMKKHFMTSNGYKENPHHNALKQDSSHDTVPSVLSLLQAWDYKEQKSVPD